MKIKKIEKEVKFVVELEKEELEEFNQLSKTLLDEIAKTKEELKLEEQVRLNLEFVHRKLEEVQGLVNDIVNLHKRIVKESIVIHEISHEIRHIFRVVTQLEKEFFPALNQKIKLIIENREIASTMRHRFSHYKRILDKLKKVLNIERLSSDEIEKISKVGLPKFKTKLNY